MIFKKKKLIYCTVKPVFKDHPGEDQEVLFEGKWSLFTVEFVLIINHWDK
jgi:hypothetical protein